MTAAALGVAAGPAARAVVFPVGGSALVAAAQVDAAGGVEADSDLTALCGRCAQLQLAIAATTERERLTLRLERIDELRKLAVHIKADRQQRALAHAEAGFELARLEFWSAALPEFENAVRLAMTPLERARWGLEVADALRGAGRLADACNAYMSVVSDVPDDGDARHALRDVALMRAARAYADLDRHDDAERLWRALIVQGVDVCTRIDACDALALAALERVDLGAANGWIDAARAAARPIALELTPEGTRARRALIRMRARDELLHITRERAKNSAAQSRERFPTR